MAKGKFSKIYLIRMGSAILRESGGQPRHFSPPFALKYIQSLLAQKRYQVKLVDCLANPQPLERLAKDVLGWPPSLMVVHTSIHSRKLAFQFVSLVKKNRDILTVVIGQGPTSNYSDYISEGSPFDIALLGEPEQEVVLLLDRLNGPSKENIDEVKKSYYNKLTENKINIVTDLDSLPFPRYNSAEIRYYQFFYPVRLNKKLKWGHILSSRGCNYRCFFCSQVTRESYGDQVRLRSPVNVVNEIEYLISIGASIISFDDDNFTFSEEHVKGVCQEILNRGLGIKWIVHARIDELNFSLMKLMKRAGCIFLRFGIESGSRRIIGILRKNPRNADWIGMSKRIFGYARRIGIATNALFMIGNPTETEDEIKDSLKLARLLKPDLIQLHFFIPYPGSIAYEQLEGKIGRKNFSQMYHYCSPQVSTSNISALKLSKIRAGFYRNFFIRFPFLIEHFFKYAPFYIHNIDVARKLSKGFKILCYF